MKYHWFIATPKTKEECQGRPDQVPGEYPTYIYNNSFGLPDVYNSILNMKPWNDDDRIVLIHDDLWIHDNQWKEKLDNAHSKFDVVGLAGSGGKLSKINIAMWNLMGEKLSGTVTHTDGKTFWTNVYGPNGMECKLLDGLFFSINPNALMEKDVQFDEDFDFHHYDSSFSISCLKAGIKMGTPECPIFVIHEGLGELNDDFYESNDRFKRKYYD